MIPWQSGLVKAIQLRPSPGDQGEDLLRKGDHNAARDGEHTVGTLRRVVGLEGQAHLEDAVAQQDQAHGADQGKDEVGKV